LDFPDENVRVTSTAVPITWKPGKDITIPTEGVPPSFFSWFEFESDQGQELDCVQIAEELVNKVYPHGHVLWRDGLNAVSDRDEDDEDLEDEDLDDEDLEDEDLEDEGMVTLEGTNCRGQ
jgi:hypothetical protein